ncbi:hypothetical protein TVAG_266580 [Trichomonas vaginalis G3]|uniref:Uncharacterized protein n=1 Tax=Trichomonas vaginalis (strain ATCC PRA-98 / G3) TaxID=412133 RepID=A2DQL1_TRIV3|nr:protein ubiquitination [Trichomonas vaginalis G3]EAY17295.1 hypothetical protein TVAG_266580 [Trichomonas vaginalis G3]KAI5523296.1 protein ubiquitination [Trichomonas vaginalis G3]|eukprot:XP_001329518.1 hypothetical protein [Trichomonas vaginalis G3]
MESDTFNFDKFKVPDVLKSLYKAEKSIWKLNAENYLSIFNNLITSLETKQIALPHILRSISAASKCRWRSLQYYLNLFDSLVDIYHFENYSDYINPQFKKFVQSKGQDREYYVQNIYENKVLNYIAFDNVEEIKKLLTEPNYKFPTEKIGDYEMNSVDFAVFHGSLNCFFFFIANGLQPGKHAYPLAVCGGNSEILRHLEDNIDKADRDLFIGSFKYAVKYHQHNIIDKILKIYDGRAEINANFAMMKYVNIKAALFLSSFHICDSIPRPHENHSHKPYEEVVNYLACVGEFDKMTKFVEKMNMKDTLKQEEIRHTVELKKRSSQVHSFMHKQVSYSFDGESFNYTYNDYPALVFALIQNNQEMIHYLVECGCAINFTFVYNGVAYTPLSYSITKKNKDIALMLIEKGANVFYLQRSPKNNKSYELFLYSMVNEMPEVAAACLKQGASTLRNVIRFKNDGKQFDLLETPLMICCKYGYLDLVKECVAQRVDVNIKYEKYPYFYMTALKYACRNGYYEIAKFLVENGADANDHYRRSSKYPHATPLMYAVYSGNAELVEFLLKNGAEPNIVLKKYQTVDDRQSYEYFTALDITIAMKSENIIKILEEQNAMTYKAIQALPKPPKPPKTQEPAQETNQASDEPLELPEQSQEPEPPHGPEQVQTLEPNLLPQIPDGEK